MRIQPISGGSLGFRGGLFLYLPGIALCAIGLTILWMPELIRYLIAGLLLTVGGILLLAARQLRSAPRSSTGVFAAFQQRLRRPFGD